MKHLYRAIDEKDLSHWLKENIPAGETFYTDPEVALSRSNKNLVLRLDHKDSLFKENDSRYKLNRDYQYWWIAHSTILSPGEAVNEHYQ
jgi:hypothetical protein